MSRLASTLCFLAAILAAPAALGQGREGIYGVTGTQPGKGAFTGRVELRWSGAGYSFIREVEFSSFRHAGRPVSTVWTGQARDVGTAVEVSLQLERMGFARSAPGLSARTTADGAPMAVLGRFVPAGNGLSGAYRGQGAPFAEPQETWAYQAPPGAAPIWRSERQLVPSHRSPSSLEKQILWAVFSPYHH